MSGNAKRRRPRAEKREVQVRTSCGYSHWWWPSPPEPGQPCICGEQVYVELLRPNPYPPGFEPTISFDPFHGERKAWRP